MDSDTPPAGNTPAVHGMLMFGAGPIFLSHLPMFHPPHHHQLIIEVEIAGPADPSGTYVRDRAQSGESVYTWVPRPFVLTDLLNPESAPDMHGTIFRGHFERGGTQITRGDVRCAVTGVVHAHPLSATGPRDTQLRYLVFGSRASMFAAHLISGAPDFDHVISVRLLSRSTSRRTVVVDGRDNDSEQRLQRGDEVRVGDSVDGASTLQVLEEIYFELGDLHG